MSAFEKSERTPNKVRTAVLIVEKNMETTKVYWGYRRIMEKKSEIAIVYRSEKGIVKTKMETTILDLQPCEFLAVLWPVIWQRRAVRTSRGAYSGECRCLKLWPAVLECFKAKRLRA